MMQEGCTDSSPPRMVSSFLVSSATAEQTSNKVIMLCMKALGAVAHKTKLTVSGSLHLDIVPPPQQKLGVQVLKPICECISLRLNL